MLTWWFLCDFTNQHLGERRETQNLIFNSHTPPPHTLFAWTECSRYIFKTSSAEIIYTLELYTPWNKYDKFKKIPLILSSLRFPYPKIGIFRNHVWYTRQMCVQSMVGNLPILPFRNSWYNGFLKKYHLHCFIAFCGHSSSISSEMCMK